MKISVGADLVSGDSDEAMSISEMSISEGADLQGEVLTEAVSTSVDLGHAS